MIFHHFETAPFDSGCSVQHVFNEDAISRCGVVNKNMGHCSHQFAILDDRTAGHECVNIGPTRFFASFK